MKFQRTFDMMRDVHDRVHHVLDHLEVGVVVPLNALAQLDDEGVGASRGVDTAALPASAARAVEPGSVDGGQLGRSDRAGGRNRAGSGARRRGRRGTAGDDERPVGDEQRLPSPDSQQVTPSGSMMRSYRCRSCRALEMLPVVAKELKCPVGGSSYG